MKYLLYGKKNDHRCNSHHERYGSRNCQSWKALWTASRGTPEIASRTTFFAMTQVHNTISNCKRTNGDHERCISLRIDERSGYQFKNRSAKEEHMDFRCFSALSGLYDFRCVTCDLGNTYRPMFLLCLFKEHLWKCWVDGIELQEQSSISFHIFELLIQATCFLCKPKKRRDPPLRGRHGPLSAGNPATGAVWTGIPRLTEEMIIHIDHTGLLFNGAK